MRRYPVSPTEHSALLGWLNSSDHCCKVLDPVLDLAAPEIPLVELFRFIGLVGHHKAGVWALLRGLRLVDDPPLFVPASCSVASLADEPDLLSFDPVSLLSLFKQERVVDVLFVEAPW